MKLKVYEYPIKHPNGTIYYGSYTIKATAKPVGFKGEKLVSVFDDPSLALIIGAEFEPNKMHIYDVKTTGAHPVHIIEGGDIITEDDIVVDVKSDLGWFWLNSRDYEYFKSKCKEIVIICSASINEM